MKLYDILFILTHNMQGRFIALFAGLAALVLSLGVIATRLAQDFAVLSPVQPRILVAMRSSLFITHLFALLLSSHVSPVADLGVGPVVQYKMVPIQQMMAEGPHVRIQNARVPDRCPFALSSSLLFPHAYLT